MGRGVGMLGQAGQWMLLEQKLKLLSIGRTLYSGQTPKSYLDLIARKHLLPLMERAHATAEPVTEDLADKSGRFLLRAVPRVGPSGAVHAVLGCYTREGDQPPPMPRVATVELDTQADVAVWDRLMFELVGLPAPEAPFAEPPVGWRLLFDPATFLDARDRITELVDAPDDRLGLMLHRHIAADGVHWLRSSWRNRSAEGTAWMLRGTMRNVDEFRLPLDEGARVGEFLAAVMELSPLPMLIYDRALGTVIQATGDCASIGLRLPADLRLHEFVHPEDWPRLSSYLDNAPPAGVHAAPLAIVRLCAAGSGDAAGGTQSQRWQSTRVTALRMRSGVDLVAVRLG